MAIEGNMDYASARILARFAQLPDEMLWRRIESSRDLAHYLNAVRASPLADWTATLDPSHDAHAIERALRDQWSHHVRELATWHPSEWQPWIVWIAWLPTLSLLAQIARPGSVPPWMLADPVLGAVAPGSVSERVAALERIGLASLAAAVLSRTSLSAAWIARWRVLFPPSAARVQPFFDTLLRILRQHATDMRRTHDSAAPQRAQLLEHFARLFRNSSGTVMASVCYLGLLALQLERLRGGLVRRALFTEQTGELR